MLQKPLITKSSRFSPTDEDKKKMEEQVQNKKSAENKDGDKKDSKKVAEPTKFDAENEQRKQGLKMLEPIHKFSLLPLSI